MRYCHAASAGDGAIVTFFVFIDTCFFLRSYGQLMFAGLSTRVKSDDEVSEDLCEEVNNR